MEMEKAADLNKFLFTAMGLHKPIIYSNPKKKLKRRTNICMQSRIDVKTTFILKDHKNIHQCANSTFTKI